MKIKKVKEFREYVKKMNPEAFNMGHFIFTNSDGEKVKKMQEMPDVCGTTGCVAGHVALAFASEGELRKGFRKFDNAVTREKGPSFIEFAAFPKEGSINELKTMDQGYFARARVVLGLNLKEANRLFYGQDGGWGSVTKKEVLASLNSWQLNDPFKEQKQTYIIDLFGKTGHEKVLKQLDYMIKTGKV